MGRSRGFPRVVFPDATELYHTAEDALNVRKESPTRNNSTSTVEVNMTLDGEEGLMSGVDQLGLEMGRFWLEYKNPNVETEFHSFFFEENKRRWRIIYGLLVPFSATFTIRAFIRGAKDLEYILECVLLVVVCIATALLTFTPRSIDMNQVSLVVATTAAWCVPINTLLSLDFQLANTCDSMGADTKCHMDLYANTGFVLAAFFSIMIAVTASAITRFRYYVPAVIMVDTGFIVVVILDEQTNWGVSALGLVLFANVLFAAMNRTIDSYLRRDFAWYKETQLMAKNHVTKMAAAKESKERVVGYLFHEVRNPINVCVLAADQALDLFSLTPSLEPLRMDQTPEPLTLNPSSRSTPTSRQRQSVSRSLPHRISPASDTRRAAPPPRAVTFGDEISVQDEGESLSSGEAEDGTRTQVSLQQLVRIIHNASDTATRVLNDALNLEKLAAGRFIFEYQSFTLDSLIRPTVNAIRSVVRGKRIELRVSIDEDIRQIPVLGDLSRLRQVLHNYLSNAFKFTPDQGRVLVRASRIDIAQATTDGRDFVETRLPICIAVSDTGVGVPLEDQDQLFTAWTQIRPAQQQGGGGTGLGLSLSKGFVQKGHDGVVGMRSPGDLGSGSTFFFNVPFRFGHDSTVREYSSPTTSSTHLLRSQATESSEVSVSTQSLLHNHDTETEHSRRMVDKTRTDVVADVLLVEDSPTTRMLMTQLLIKLGLSCDEAEHGQAAVNLVDSGKRYHVILMDKEMPVMEGGAATRKIREIDPSTVIVGLTGNGLECQQASFFACGLDYVMVKPFSRDQIVDMMTRVGLLERAPS